MSRHSADDPYSSQSNTIAPSLRAASFLQARLERLCHWGPRVSQTLSAFLRRQSYVMLVG